MAEFNYTAKDQQGKTVKGKLQAASQDEAQTILKQRNLLIIDIKKAAKKMDLLSGISASVTSVRVSSDDLAVFARQLATMVNAGLPLMQGLDILQEQSDKKSFKNLINNVRESVEEGSSLSEALARYPRAFPALFINMIAAGEASGMLDEILLRMANYLEETSKLQKKIRSALVYPAAITFIAVAISIFMLVKVVPAFKEIYEGFGGQLPGPTQMLLTISDIVRHWLLLVILGFVAIIVGIYLFARTDRGKLLIDKTILKLPIVGKLAKKLAISRFTRTLSTLSKSGVAILTALDIVGKTTGNKVIENVIKEAAESVKGGESIAQPLAKSDLFPSLVVRMIAVGEQTGSLEEMLVKISNFYDTEVSTTVESLTSLIEPVVIIFLGLIIGGIVMALYLPVFNIAELVG